MKVKVLLSPALATGKGEDMANLVIKIQKVKWVNGKPVPIDKLFTPKEYLIPNAKERRL